MGSNPIVQQVAVLFLIMAVGMVAAKRDIIDEQVRRKLSELLLYITSPFLVVSSFNFKYSSHMLMNAGIILAFSLGAHFFSVLLGKVLFLKYSTDKQSVLKFIIVFSNCGFMGFPVLESLFGKIGVFYGSINNVIFNIFVWTYGVMLFNQDKERTSIIKILINPGIISVIIGMTIFLFSIQLPEVIVQTLDMVGSMTAPLSMLIVGALLSSTDYKSIFRGFEVYYGAILRLIIIPLITIAVLKLIGMDSELLKVCVVFVAMPAAANTAIFAEKYGGNSILASRCVALSTILSIITIPLIMTLI